MNPLNSDKQPAKPVESTEPNRDGNTPETAEDKQSAECSAIVTESSDRASPVVSDLEITLIGVTDRGLQRKENQDTVIVGDLESATLLELVCTHQLRFDVAGRGPLVVVCDGMGGGLYGNIASDVAARTIFRELCSDRATTQRSVFARQLRRALRAGNVAVRERALELGTKTMGTTAAAAGIVDRTLVLALVGDCRAYIFRSAVLTQVTRDQSVVSALVSAGAITDKEARLASNRHLVLQALGPDPDVDVGLSLVELRRGDRLLVSSDGLHGVVDDSLIAQALKSHPNDEQGAIQKLLELAHQAGAPDNISAVLVRFDGDAFSPVGPNDNAPRFTEVDPFAEGESALMQTSKVARRLAQRAGLGATSAEMPIPATGTHALLTVDVPAPACGATMDSRRPSLGPAERRLAARAHLHWGWLVAAVVLVAVTAWVVFG